MATKLPRLLTLCTLCRLRIGPFVVVVDLPREVRARLLAVRALPRKIPIKPAFPQDFDPVRGALAVVRKL